MQISIIDLKKQYKPLEREITSVLSGIIKAQSFILGEEVENLEKNIAQYCGTRYAIGVNSGTDALILALVAAGVGKDSEVITTPFTFVASSEAIVHVGAKPVFVDINPKTYNIDQTLIESKITKKTKAILPVHLYGLCACMNPILEIAKKHKIEIIEDCAQAIGSEYKAKKAGSMGIAGAISFYPGKNLGCFGDGGMVTTNDRGVYEKIKLLRNHGSQEKYCHKIIGYNSRLDNLQAAVLNIKLKHLDLWLEGRIRNAEFFTESLKDYPILPQANPKDYRHSFHHYVARTKNAEECVKYLNSEGIGARIYYPIPMHLQECFKFLGYKPGDFPEAEALSRESLAIPVYPELTQPEKDFIVNKIKEFFNKN